jgi:hypothetical protein
MKTLCDAIAARDAAHGGMTAATAATERARQTAAAAQSRVDELATAERARIEQHARRLEAWTVAGSSGAPPVLVADATALQGDATAKATLSAARETVTRLGAAENVARTTLAAAEQAVEGVRNELRRAEADRIATRLSAIRREEYALCARLAVLEFDTPAAMTEGAQDAFQNAPAKPTLQHFTSGSGYLVDIHSSIGGDRSSLDQARAFWNEYDRAAESPPPAEAA